MTTIVFIDDEVQILNAIKRLLRDKEWEILTYTSPQQAVSELQNRSDISIIVSDYRMPGMSGVETLNILKRYCPDALRILLSGQADLNGVLDAVNQAEIYRFITKPWLDEDFVVTLSIAIHHQKLMQENFELSEVVRRQRKKINTQLNELLKLERENPGITKVDWDDEGLIDLSDEFGSED